MAGFGTTKLSPKARKQKKKLQQKFPSADLSDFGQQSPEDQGLLAPLAWFKDGDPATVFQADFLDGTLRLWVTGDDGTNHHNLIRSAMAVLQDRAKKKQTVQTLTGIVCFHTTTCIQRVLLAQYLDAPMGGEIESDIADQLFNSGVRVSVLPTSSKQEEELTQTHGMTNKIYVNQ